ncbi:oxysterol-binding protein 1-like [Argiope bruennichi]|uniref:oxysterol-binding protein 1-like n=1 Tax=Argiope bruennichi TaxID=94029 RepID=UPI002493D87C|nr:oxysterol-binding protein 1-like [Argiope bruennichi]XP_055945900.1 oxysterol-binding protein 1-like [Argiope bruennichi]XP_055945908.1 oxysterol-binding protein 1-like [Argiope bruennichi]
MAETKSAPEPEMKGWLYKWTNYLKGYQKRWFVLYNGLLSYYRNPNEVAHTCRGTINLVSAVIHTVDSSNFVISNGGTQTFHLKASNEIERQRWVTALELAKARAIRMTESDEDEDYSLLPAQTDKNELQGVLKTLNAKLEDLSTCNDLILKHGFALQRSLSEIENLETVPDAVNKIRSVNERATLFRITSNAMINACQDYLQLAQTQGRKWMKMVQHEHEQRLRLEEMVEQLAKQHSHLERAAKEASANSPGMHSDDDEFYDAEEETGSDFVITIPGKVHRRTPSGFSLQSEGQDLDGGASSDTDAESSNINKGEDMIARRKKRNRGQVHSVCVTNHCEDNESDSERKASSASESPTHSTNIEKDNKSLVPVKKRRLTVPEKPNYSLNLWSIMKNCIGKELTKIPMPVNFNEPLSTLQRLTEEYEYSDLLDKAAQCSDSCEQMTYVAAYTVSAYATTSNRTGKPFNPLLGETYECDRTDDYGWRCLSEQVSHHPPMLAQHCEGRGWICWQEFTMSSKFRGKYLQIIPLGIAHLLFPASGNHYTWRKVTTFVHNIIVGRLWVDHHGEMEIVNHHTEDKCHLRFIPYSYFSREVPRKVTGVVTDHEGNAKFVLQGTWDNKMESARVLNSHGSVKGKPLLETSSPKTIWRRQFPGPEYEKMYNFTVLACQLNEPEEGVAPTDSRLRPDQRLMEDGAWDEANRIKVQLEEKQRQVRRKREEEAEQAASEGRPYQGYEPIWFTKETDEITGNPVHKFKGEYWKCKEDQDWSRCPDIYL